MGVGVPNLRFGHDVPELTCQGHENHISYHVNYTTVVVMHLYVCDSVRYTESGFEEPDLQEQYMLGQLRSSIFPEKSDLVNFWGPD